MSQKQRKNVVFLTIKKDTKNALFEFNLKGSELFFH